MPEVRADGIAVYVYRRVGSGVEFLQIRRTAATGEYQWSWQTVYGGVEAGETAVRAAVRELREETGLRPVRMWQVEFLETFYFRPHDYVLLMPVFGVEVKGDEGIVLNAEHDGYRWVGEGEVGEKFMWRTQREAIGVLLEELRAPGGASGYLEVDLGREG
ncbi:MAG: NUDIX hydrolase [Phycisphaerae bacterium]